MSKKRVVYFDVLNIAACIAVVMLHHNGIVHHYISSVAWSQALVIEVLFYWAVPIFFMLSGATLMSYRERYNTKDFFLSRVKRTFLPFIIWSCVWIILVWMRDGVNLSPKNIIVGILQSNFQPVYWFFIPLFGIYIMMPLLSLLNNNFKYIKYLAIVLFMTTSVINPSFELLDWPKIGYLQNAMAGPILYVVIGKYLSCNGGGEKWYYWLLSILTLLCFILRFYLTYKLSSEEGELNRILFNYYYFTAVIPAIWVFLTIKKVVSPDLSEKTINTLKKISSCSFGIYLLHNLVMAIEVRVFCMSPESLVWRIIMPFSTYALCLLVVFTAKKHKMGKFIFP